MSKLPVGWAEARLDELLAAEPAAITDGPFGSNLKREHYTDAGPRVIRLQNIGNGAFRGERAYISVERFEALKRHDARPGDVIVAALGETLPRACVVPSGLGPAIVKADCIRVRLHPRVNERFVSAMLNSPAVRRVATGEISGVGRPRLNLAKIRAIRIPVPPAGEQDRIVAAIEEQFTRLDDGERSLTGAKLRVAALRKAVLAAAVTDVDRWVLTSEVAEVQGGIQKQPTRRPVENRFPFLRVANVGRNQLDLADVHGVELFKGELARYGLQPGDLLVVEGNGSPGQIGRSALWRGEIANCVHQNHLIRVRPGPLILPEYLALYWNAPQAAERLRAIASSTSGLYTLSTAKVKSIPIPVVGLDEQRRIVAETERHLSLLGAVATAIDHALTRSEHLRRSLLERAFSGRLVPQDPTDEPACELLKRIEHERGQLTKPRRGRRTHVGTVKS